MSYCTAITFDGSGFVDHVLLRRAASTVRDVQCGATRCLQVKPPSIFVYRVHELMEKLNKTELEAVEYIAQQMMEKTLEEEIDD